MINTAAKRNLVQLCYYITREFSSAFSRINRQTSETSIPTEKCFKLAQKPCGRVVKRKYNLNGINTALRRAPSMKTLRLFWGSWIIVTGPLEILNWCSEMLRMSTPEKKTARLFKSESDGPWRFLNWLLLQQENLLMLTAVLLWCHQLPFKWWKDSEGGPAFGKKPLYTSLQTRQGVRFIIVAIRFPIS